MADERTMAVERVKRLMGDVPDSRARSNRGEIRTPHGNATPVYCANCGKFAGYVFGDIQGMFYLCDGERGCDKYGRGLDLPMVDEQTARAVETKEEAGPCSITT